LSWLLVVALNLSSAEQKLAVVLAGYPQQESMTPRLRALAAALIDRQIVKNKSAEVRRQSDTIAARGLR
jgi:hypothetical protein